MRDFVLFVAFFLAFVAIVYYAMNAHVIPFTNRLVADRLNDALKGDKRYDGMSDKQIERMFDSSSTSATRYYDIEDARRSVRTEDQANPFVESPFTVADCRSKNRSCLSDGDCDVLCRREANTLKYRCDQKLLVCVETGVVINDDSNVVVDDDDNDKKNQPPIKCKNELGEYALLQGYNNLGVAEWNCVQLFPSWTEPGKRYCEGGTMRLDTRKGMPSYKQCECPSDTKRIVYRRSIGQTIFATGLPHCVKNSKLFETNDDYVVYDK